MTLYVQPGIPPLLWVGVAGWIGTNLCFPLSSLACLPGYSFFLQRPLLPNLGTLRCEEEHLLPHCHVTLRADRTLLIVWDAPLPSGEWKPVKHLGMTANGKNSPFCPPLVLRESVSTSIVFFTPLLTVFKLPILWPVFSFLCLFHLSPWAAGPIFVG